MVCDASKLTSRFGSNRFDVIISTEMLEHVKDWQKVISQMKRVLKPPGVILLTTRSFGCPYHAFPLDFWRFEPEDMKEIFADFSMEAIEKDPLLPGVFVKARKQESFQEKSLRSISLYSMMRDQKINRISSSYVFLFRLRAKLQSLFLKAG